MGEATTMQPKRRRWRRVMIALGVFVLLVVAARLWWGWSAERELQAVVDEIRARGEPLAWKDFAPAPVPDEQNAVVLYRKANAVLQEASDANEEAKRLQANRIRIDWSDPNVFETNKSALRDMLALERPA